MPVANCKLDQDQLKLQLTRKKSKASLLQVPPLP